jgi:hypothetical protein
MRSASSFITRGYSGHLSPRGLRCCYTREYRRMERDGGPILVADDVLVEDKMVFKDLYSATVYLEDTAQELGPAIAVMLMPPQAPAFWLVGAYIITEQ